MHGSCGHHHHSHHHHGHAASFDKAFGIGIALNTLFVIVEGSFGYWSGSLALIADAGHNVTDVLSLVLAWVASMLSARAPSRRFTYGLRRFSILAALINAVLLLVAIGAIGLESLKRLFVPALVESHTVVAVAIVGIIINAGTAILFMRGKDSDLNIRGAYLHMAADAAVSLGVVLAGIAIAYTGWGWIDPVTSLVICAVILIGSWELLMESLRLSIDAVPAGIEPEAVGEYLASLPEVIAVHDLHIWALGTSSVALTAHIVRPSLPDESDLLCTIRDELRKRFRIHHVTIQIERGDSAAQCDVMCGVSHGAGME